MLFAHFLPIYCALFDRSHFLLEFENETNCEEPEIKNAENISSEEETKNFYLSDRIFYTAQNELDFNTQKATPTCHNPFCCKDCILRTTLTLLIVGIYVSILVNIVLYLAKLATLL